MKGRHAQFANANNYYLHMRPLSNKNYSYMRPIVWSVLHYIIRSDNILNSNLLFISSDTYDIIE